MRKLMILTAFLTGIGCAGIAAADVQPILNQITLNLAAEQWVTTNIAKVTVSVDASLDKGGLEQARNQIMANLNQIVKNAEWHITTFDRSQDQSGLERLHVTAQADIQESQLANLREQAKAVSKPGMTYQISGIAFTPSLAEQQQTRVALREKIYQRAKEELERINKMYPDQHYFINYISFEAAIGIDRPGIMMMRAVAPAPAEGQQTTAATGVSVSDKLSENARVVIASIADKK